jgi:hypothetical protein
MVFHNGRTANTSEESLLHPTLKPDDRDLWRRLQSWRLDRQLDPCNKGLSRVRYPQEPCGRTATE